MLNIGRIIDVRSLIVCVEIYADFLEGSAIVKNELHDIVSVNSYCKIYTSSGYLIAKIINEKATPFANPEIGKMLKDNYYKIIEAKIIGKLVDNKFIFGITKLPNVFSSVFSISEKEKNLILNHQREKQILYKMGSYLEDKSIDFKVDVNDFLKFHTGIFGITGTGKLYTIGKIIQMINEAEKDVKLSRKNDFSTVLFDVTGEFKQINASILNLDSYRIPLEELDYKDWSVLLFASKKTQEAFLKNLDKNLNDFKNHGDMSKVIKKILNHILKDISNRSKNDIEKNSKIKSLKQYIKSMEDKNNDYKSFFNEVYEIFEKVDISYGVLCYNGQADNHGQLFNNINSIKTPLKSTKNFDLTFEIFDSIFEILKLESQMQGGNWFNNVEPLFRRYGFFKTDLEKMFDSEKPNILDAIMEPPSEEKFVKVINFDKYVSERLMPAYVGIITSKLYEKTKQKGLDKKSNLLLIYDEAHKYMDNKNSEDYENRTQELLEEISREGRKFGVSLFIATQKPSDISDVILSQCSNFISHKIISPIDIKKIRNIISYLDETSFEMLSYLAPGNAVFAGRFQEFPQIILIDKPISIYSPKSDVDDIYVYQNES